MQNEVRAMLEGALISGLFLVMIFLTIYTPLGIVTALALPIPFTVYAARHRLRNAILVIVASGLLTIIIGALPSILLSLFAGVLGTVMGTAYHRQKSAFIAFVGGLLASLCLLILGVVVSYYMTKINPITAMQTMLKESMAMSKAMLENFNMVDPKQVDKMDEMIEFVPKLAPMLLIFASAQSAMLNHWLSRKILRRLGSPAPAFPPFRDWRWPRSMLYIYLGVTIAAIFLSANQDQFSYVIVLNLKPILDTLMIIQGLSLVSFYSHQKGWGRGLLIIAIVMLFIFSPIPFILVLLGVLDLSMNVRKPLSKK
ncbi:YybS family protein [Ammoniphilus oxalaticus]|nr:YybS family protein [Ammoniphilus oxalaticus]